MTDARRQRSKLVQETTAHSKDSLTVLWHELEEWQRDNHFITSGYRPASNSYWRSAGSLAYLHNESVNIYSHLFGALIALLGGAVLYSAIKPRFEQATNEDVVVFSCYFLGAIACLGMSATYHTIANHSEHVAKFGNRLDYIGIVFLIWGSFVSTQGVHTEDNLDGDDRFRPYTLASARDQP